MCNPHRATDLLLSGEICYQLHMGQGSLCLDRRVHRHRQSWHTLDEGQAAQQAKVMVMVIEHMVFFAYFHDLNMARRLVLSTCVSSVVFNTSYLLWFLHSFFAPVHHFFHCSSMHGAEKTCALFILPLKGRTLPTLKRRHTSFFSFKFFWKGMSLHVVGTVLYMSV